MSIPATAAQASGTAVSLPDNRDRRRGRRGWTLIGVIVAVAATAAVAVAVTDPFGHPSRSAGGVADNAYPTSTATIERRSLASQTNLNATLGYAETYSLVGHQQGTYTWLPAAGQVIRQGQVLYRADGYPVVLLYGSTPAYRNLAEGATAASLAGADVAQLDADLVALGYATVSEIPAGSNEFSWWTKVAVENLQTALGVTVNGSLALGQVVFLPSAARVTSLTATLGGPAGPGQPVLTATSTVRSVTIALDAAQQSQVKAGDKVVITLPDGSTTPGVVASVGTVATAAGGSTSSPTVTVEVTPTDPAGTGSVDQAPVQVSITTATVADALAVPVDALMATSAGGYALEAINADGTHALKDVTLGLFDDVDGLVQVTGSGVAAGERVVVPAT